MAETNSRDKELVLAPNEFAFISDKTKGNVVSYVGPYKVSLSGTDSPVTFGDKSKRFTECNLETAIQLFATAPEGWYLILKNPAISGKHPDIKSSNDLTELNIGKKVNIPGPTSFPLWPGQIVKTVRGHNLRSNQYLVVQVYDDVAAKENWKSGIVKANVTPVSENASVPSVPVSENASVSTALHTAPSLNLTMGSLLVIKGTEVSFYIPPTGVEVIPERGGVYIRDAVTLERLEYCILLDEDGNKRYVQGPKVVFPEPTEVFLEKEGSRKYKAIELNENSGIYVKVIADYEEKGSSYKTGDELFITGKDQMIYFPRPEHAIIKYNNQIVHHAVAIPIGEARYVLNRETGDVAKKVGTCMFLPDPRKEVIVRRVLSPKQVEMWFPGNREALEYNTGLASMSLSASYVPDNELRAMTASMSSSSTHSRNSANSFHMEDGFDRKTSYTPPRTITLDTKYDGAVSVNVWTGYAIQVVSKLGNRKVIVGPTSYLLEYDETLELMELSTGKPKNTDKLLKTAYLRCLNNKIGDIITVQTRDYCDLRVKVSYCVNFEGDKDKWFNAENYVKLLCDHMRSKLRSEAKQWSIQEFYANSTSIVKDSVLGFNPDPDVPGKGYSFAENGMHVYDVEVLGVDIVDRAIADSLIQAQQDSLDYMLGISKLQQKLEFVKQQEDITRQLNDIGAETVIRGEAIKQKTIAEKLITDLLSIDSEMKVNSSTQRVLMEKAENDSELFNCQLEREMSHNEVKLAYSSAVLEQGIKEKEAESAALKMRAEAISPQLIATLANLADKGMLEKIMQAVSPMAIVNGESIVDTMQKMLKGSVLEDMTIGIINANK